MHAAIAVSCAALVTAARALLLQRWPAFAEASQRSNGLVMPKLSALDLAWLAALPGFSEELLFRGALIPSLYPDWCTPPLTALCPEFSSGSVQPGG